eukprot:12398935-Alexandrium_andersonii.AAC.1
MSHGKIAQGPGEGGLLRTLDECGLASKDVFKLHAMMLLPFKLRRPNGFGSAKGVLGELKRGEKDA